MATEKKTRGSKKGKGRPSYSEEQKQEILSFIKGNPGRGILKQAAEKFKISYPTVNNWVKSAGVIAKAPRGIKAGRKAGTGGIVNINGVKYAPVEKSTKVKKAPKALIKSLNAIEKALATLRKSI